MVLVTGGTGMLGAHVLVELSQTHEKVRALCRTSSQFDHVKRIFSYYFPKPDSYYERIEWVIADLKYYEDCLKATEAVSTVYHVAAEVSFAPKKHMQLIQNNTLTTRNIVNASLENRVGRFCHVSSIAALGEAQYGSQITEQTTKNNFETSSGYAISKFSSEAEVWRAIEEGLNAVIVNPSVILGPGNWAQGSPSLIATVAEGLNYYTEGITGFVDVRDVAKLMVQLTESDINAESFLLSSENLSFKTLFGMIAHELKRMPPNKKATKRILNIAKQFEKIRSLILGKEPRITSETIQAAFSEQYYSSEKIKERLTFQFMPIEQSVRDICRLYLREH